MGSEWKEEAHEEAVECAGLDTYGDWREKCDESRVGD